jgi:hypothetical protein
MKAYGVMQFFHSNVLSLQMFTRCTVNCSSRQERLTDSKVFVKCVEREREVFRAENAYQRAAKEISPGRCRHAV